MAPYGRSLTQDAHGTVSTEEETASTIIARQNVLLSEKGAQVQSTTLLMGLISEN